VGVDGEAGATQEVGPVQTLAGCIPRREDRYAQCLSTKTLLRKLQSSKGRSKGMSGNQMRRELMFA
jgi:hypothetical protein